MDVLCVNQSQEQDALRERASQVQMMGSICSIAEEVMIDLGEAEESLERLLDFFTYSTSISNEHQRRAVRRTNGCRPVARDSGRI